VGDKIKVEKHKALERENYEEQVPQIGKMLENLSEKGP